MTEVILPTLPAPIMSDILDLMNESFAPPSDPLVYAVDAMSGKQTFTVNPSIKRTLRGLVDGLCDTLAHHTQYWTLRTVFETQDEPESEVLNYFDTHPELHRHVRDALGHYFLDTVDNNPIDNKFYKQAYKTANLLGDLSIKMRSTYLCELVLDIIRENPEKNKYLHMLFQDYIHKESLQGFVQHHVTCDEIGLNDSDDMEPILTYEGDEVDIWGATELNTCQRAKWYRKIRSGGVCVY
jgi:hypothetical protein